MKRCPCCDHLLLQQFRQHQLSWFCRTCWQEMPVTEANQPLTVAAIPKLVVTQTRTVSLNQVRSRLESHLVNYVLPGHPMEEVSA
jgi:hypothetical protein